MVEGGPHPLQVTARPIWLALAIAALVLAVTAVYAAPAQARPACADAIIEEWSSGMLVASYSLDCYEAAIDALPEDLRAYTSAADDISRVAIEAGRSDAPARSLASVPASASSEDARSFPLTVALLGVFVALLAASGLAASMLRRRRTG